MSTPGGRAFEAEGTAITKALRSERVWSMEDKQGVRVAGAEGVKGDGQGEVRLWGVHRSIRSHQPPRTP